MPTRLAERLADAALNGLERRVLVRLLDALRERLGDDLLVEEMLAGW